MTNEKLVRDKIPDIIKRDGGSPKIREVSGMELDQLIRLKIVEEATELLESGENEEIVDLFEILDALVSHRGLDSELLKKMRLDKAHKRGTFKRGFVLAIDE